LGVVRGRLAELGERRAAPAGEDLEFLGELGLVDATGELSASGREYFHAAFVLKDADAARRILARALLDYPAASALVQLLDGVASADKAVAETVLRSQGFGMGLTERKVGTLLTLLDHAGLVLYSKRDGRLEVLLHPAREEEVPRSVFISPRTPFANRAWLRRVLEECEGFIWWLDKHFMPAAFEAIAEAADGHRIAEVRILSLKLAEHESRKAKRQYSDLRRELDGRGIRLSWHTVDSARVKDTHDRWILGRTTARNVPNVNAILGGQHAELNVSDQGNELRELFGHYWGVSVAFPDNEAEAPDSEVSMALRSASAEDPASPRSRQAD
jgi:hypothetical protein